MKSMNTGVSRIDQDLARSRLGAGDLAKKIWAAAAPVLVVGGIMPVALMMTGLTSLPMAFILMGVVLLLWTSGFVSLASRINTLGAVYSMAARGLGRTVAPGAGAMMYLAYTMMLVGLYGSAGPALADFLATTASWSVPWWACALPLLLLVTVLGVQRIKLSATVLGVALALEGLYVASFIVAAFVAPADGNRWAWEMLDPSALIDPRTWSLLAVGITGYVGLEMATIYATEARDSRRDVARSTRGSLLVLIVTYVGGAYALGLATGPANLVAAAQEHQTGLLFHLMRGYFGGWAQPAGVLLFLASMTAGMIAFHNSSARYLLAMGRDTVLSRRLGQASPRTQAPRTASMLQALICACAIGLVAVMGWDPVVVLFYWMGTSGGFGVLLGLIVASMAVIGFYLRPAARQLTETLWQRLLAPTAAAVALSVIAGAVVLNFATLLGLQDPHDPLAYVLPAVFPAVFVLFTLWGAWLRWTRPAIHSAIGSAGITAAVVDAVPPQVTVGAR